MSKIVTLRVETFHIAPAAELFRPWVWSEKPRSLAKVWDILLMASGKSAFLSEKVKNLALGDVAFDPNNTLFTALWTTAAATDMDAYHGGTAGEVSGGSYDRVSKTNNTTNFASVTGDAAKVNSNAHTFPTATANWNSGNVIPQMGIFDANNKTSADNLFIWGDLTTAKSVLNGDTAQFNTSAISWTEE